MDVGGTLIARLRRVDLRLVDGVLALLLTAGALVDASLLTRGLGGVAVVALVVLAGSVAWRRVNPVLATVVAVAGFGAFELSSRYTGDGAFEVAAIALNFYTLGRCTRGRDGMLVSAGVFACWLVAAGVAGYSTGGAPVGDVLLNGVLFGALPFAVGRTLTSRGLLARELEVSAARLTLEQEVRARGAAADERNRMARELHDVIAHHVSVMVIQASAAGRVAYRDLLGARAALAVVEGAGRDALVELRRIVGVLRRGGDELAGAAAPGLSQLEALADRARAAGLPVELRIEGQRSALTPGLDLVAFRVIQEALTNTIKHAGRAHAQVSVTVGARELELEVLDDGGSSPRSSEDPGESGHGLVGMSERIGLYGGELRTGHRANGGFQVRARIPLDGAASMPPLLSAPNNGDGLIVATMGRVRWRWLDPLLAGVVLVAMEVEVLSSGHRRGPLFANVLVLAAMASALLWRRRAPLWFLVAVGALVTLLSATLTSLQYLPLAGIYITLVPTYTVAAWAQRRRAVLGLAIFICGTAANILISHQTIGDFAGAAFTVTAAWTAGYAIRARRRQTSTLRHTFALLAGEREDRARLAVAGERSRIARELHTVVARSVAAMVVQAEAANGLLHRDPQHADDAISEIVETGRQALVDMRRILGVLRHSDQREGREPQPGVDQIHALIQHARQAGHPVELTINGDPGTLPAGLDLGIYRILEDALNSAREHQVAGVDVALRFSDEDLELQLTAKCPRPNGWPTTAMRERVTLCGGELHTPDNDDQAWRFVARMPRTLQGALT